MTAMMSVSPNDWFISEGALESGLPRRSFAFGWFFLSISIASDRFIGSSIFGRKRFRDCLAAAMVSFCQRETALGFLDCFTVRSKIMGVILSIPNSVHLVMVRSKRSPFGIETAIIIWG